MPKLNTLLDNFLKKEENSFNNKKRNYLHFDRKISFNQIKGVLFNKLRYPATICSHSFYPFLKITISTPRYKKNIETGLRFLTYKNRDILYSSHFDSLIYSYYSTLLSLQYEHYLNGKKFEKSIIAYRSLDKNNIHFAQEVFEFIKNKGECVVLAFDVSKFFENLDHKKLEKAWTKLIKKEKLPLDHWKVFRNITKYSFVETNKLDQILGQNKKIKKYRICEPNDFRLKVRAAGLIETNKSGKGIPQGSPISATLSNLYMIEFDKIISKMINRFSGLYKRYSDDIIVVCELSNYKNIERKVTEYIKNICDLELNRDKTDITIFKYINEKLTAYDESLEKNKKIQYLGFEFDGQHIYIRSSSMSRYYRRMKNTVSVTVNRAYGKKSRGDRIFRKKLYEKCTVKGKRNFNSYAMRASKIMDSTSIRKQTARHFDIIKKEISKKALKREEELKSKNKFKKSML